MKILVNFLSCFLCIVFLSSCSNSDVWVERELTKCGDNDLTLPVTPATREAELEAIQLMIEDSLNIDIIEIKEEFRSSTEEDCEACSCKSGNVISLKVDEMHVAALEAFRFY